MRLRALLACCALTVGCVVEDKVPGGQAGGGPDADGGGEPAGSGDDDDGAMTSVGLNLQVLVVDKAGMQTETFDNPDDVFFTVQVADATQPVVAEDYMFQVIDSGGALVSEDAFSCRVFHVNERGLIDSVQSVGGDDCRHETARAADGTLLVRAKPFERPGSNDSAAQLVRLRVKNLAACRSDSEFDGGFETELTLSDDD